MVMYSLSEISNKWQPLAPYLSVPHTEAEYDNLSAFLDQLIDEVGNDDRHPLAALMDTVGTLIEAYDKEHFPFSEGDPLGVLKYLMANHNITQSDLPHNKSFATLSGSIVAVEVHLSAIALSPELCSAVRKRLTKLIQKSRATD